GPSSTPSSDSSRVVRDVPERCMPVTKKILMQRKVTSGTTAARCAKHSPKQLGLAAGVDE
ncbi:MAG: hypothetical protein ACI970_000596, partial [Myxococcota bacterium]